MPTPPGGESWTAETESSGPFSEPTWRWLKKICNWAQQQRCTLQPDSPAAFPNARPSLGWA